MTVDTMIPNIKYQILIRLDVVAINVHINFNYNSAEIVTYK